MLLLTLFPDLFPAEHFPDLSIAEQFPNHFLSGLRLTLLKYPSQIFVK